MRENSARARFGSPRRTPPAALAVASLLALMACGGAPPPPVIPATFPETPVATLDSDAGSLHIVVRSFPEPLVRGQNVGQVTITDAAGQPVDGLTLDVKPWMPSHGHGTSVDPASSATGPGVFVANPLYLFMAGQWELHMTIDGSVHDTATAVVDIP